MSDKANISVSDSDDSNENEQQMEKEGEGVQLVVKKIQLPRFGSTLVLCRVKKVPAIVMHLGVGCVTKGFQQSALILVIY